jgi:peptidoglycan/LPS O-acetylase OafA/YrhL
MKYRADIDGLRAIAVLPVVLFHADVPLFAGGFVGVDVFFVISGYLITELLVREFESTGRISVIQFYARRARRLLPAFGLMLICVLAAAVFLLTPPEQDTLARTALAAAAYVSNFYFIAQAADYFAPDIKTNVLLHTWSLGVEEQFYLVWPAFIAGAHWLGGRRAFIACCALAVVLSVAAAFVLSPPWAFFSLPARAWELGVGALGSFVTMRFSAVTRSATGIAGLAAIVGFAITADGNTLSPVTMALPVLGTVAVLISGTQGSVVASLLGLWPFRMIGRVSYGWYLWHWPLLVMPRLVETWIPPTTRLLCVALALALAVASYVLVEKPVRSARHLALRPIFSIALAALITGGSIAASIADQQWAQGVLANDPQYQKLWIAASEPRLCTQWQRSELLECSYGDPNAPITAILFGDSLAGEWASTLKTIAEQQRWRMITLLNGECSVPDIFPSGPPNCHPWRQHAMERIAELHPSAVIFSFSRVYPLWSGRSRFDEALRQTLERFSKLGIPTVVIAPTPTSGIDAPNCLMRPSRVADPKRCDALRKDAIDAKLVEDIKTAATNLPGVQVWDFTDRFCDDNVCPAIKDDTLVYSDGTHATAAFIRTLAPELELRLRALFEHIEPSTRDANARSVSRAGGTSSDVSGAPTPKSTRAADIPVGNAESVTRGGVLGWVPIDVAWLCLIPAFVFLFAFLPSGLSPARLLASVAIPVALFVSAYSFGYVAYHTLHFNDSPTYLQRLLSGTFASNRNSGYPSFLVAVSDTVGLDRLAWIQLGAMIACYFSGVWLLVAHLGRKWLGPILALMFVLQGVATEFSNQILTEALFTAGISLCAASLGALAWRPGTGAVIAGMIGIVLATLAKSIGVVLVLPALLLVRFLPKEARLRVSVSLVAAGLVAYGGMAAYNYSLTGIFSPESFAGSTLVGNVAWMLDDASMPKSDLTRPMIAAAAQVVAKRPADLSQIDSFAALDRYVDYTAREYDGLFWGALYPVGTNHFATGQAEDAFYLHFALSSIRAHPAAYFGHAAAHFYGLWRDLGSIEPLRVATISIRAQPLFETASETQLRNAVPQSILARYPELAQLKAEHARQESLPLAFESFWSHYWIRPAWTIALGILALGFSLLFFIPSRLSSLYRTEIMLALSLNAYFGAHALMHVTQARYATVGVLAAFMLVASFVTTSIGAVKTLFDAKGRADGLAQVGAGKPVQVT